LPHGIGGWIDLALRRQSYRHHDQESVQ
jgi:hypothetical protein